MAQVRETQPIPTARAPRRRRSGSFILDISYATEEQQRGTRRTTSTTTNPDVDKQQGSTGDEKDTADYAREVPVWEATHQMATVGGYEPRRVDEEDVELGGRRRSMDF